MDYGSSQANPIIGLLPWFIIGIPFGIVLMMIAIRKGRSKLGWFLIGFVPIVNFIGGLWLASLPDSEIMQKIDAFLDKNSKTN